MTTASGALARSVLPVVQPNTTRLGQGVEIRMSTDRSAEMLRNGPRPLRKLRTISITGGGLDWMIPGTWIGTPSIVDTAGDRTLWSPKNRGSVHPGLTASEASVVVALVVSGAPQSTSSLNILSYL